MAAVWKALVKTSLSLLIIIFFVDLITADQCTSCAPISTDPNTINVHLVCHTHDDVGWLKSVDSYFYGADQFIQNAKVEDIIASAVKELYFDERKRFIYVEIAFFQKYWNELSEHLRNKVRALVNEGRLEFILAGWTMPDEATTHYTALIDQTELGLRFIKDNFGACAVPRVAWQIDPFGHSKELASLYGQMGFDGLFFARLDYQDRIVREANKTQEFLWFGRTEAESDKDSRIFTGVLYHHYTAPSGFDFDIMNSGRPTIVDDPKSPLYNVDTIASNFRLHVTTQAKTYRSNNIMLTMGSDFNYQSASSWYNNLDKLIAYFQRNPKGETNQRLNVFYSTPTCYLRALHQSNLVWDTKTDDFFPYAHVAHGYWTGYFTSRSALKYNTRRSNGLLQACKQLNAIAGLGLEHLVSELKEAMGVLQHHDAVSGTEKQLVADDYARLLAIGTDSCNTVVARAAAKLLQLSGPDSKDLLTFCPQLNESWCPLTNTAKDFQIYIYNPLARAQDVTIRVPVSAGNGFLVTGPGGNAPRAQTIKTHPMPIPGAGNASAELSFRAHLLPLGWAVFRASEIDKQPITDGTIVTRQFSLQNDHMILEFDNKGFLQSVFNKQDNVRLTLSQQLLSYYGDDNGSPFSGAYIFRPNSTIARPVLDPRTYATVTRASLCSEVFHYINTWAKQVIRLCDGDEFFSIEWQIGPMPQNNEMISRFSSDIKSAGQFFTDSNGRQAIKRIRNHRATWNYVETEPIASNYYPVTSFVYLEDDSRLLGVVTDRSQGASSINDGHLELMLHRITYYDDGLGVGEPLDERGPDGRPLIVRGVHHVVVANPDNGRRTLRDLANRAFHQPILAFASKHRGQKRSWSASENGLPPNVNLLTLDTWSSAMPGHWLMRFEHFYDNGENSDLSKPVQISLQNFLQSARLNAVSELGLAANVNRTEAGRRLRWQTKSKSMDSNDFELTESIDTSTDLNQVRLRPMEIRTYKVAATLTSGLQQDFTWLHYLK